MKMKFRIRQAEKNALCENAPEFKKIAENAQLHDFECDQDLFHALALSIVSQQLSLRAADAVFRKIESRLKRIDAERILLASQEELRACGLSFRKIEYLKGVAEAKLSGRLEYDDFAKKTDAEAIEELVKLKGIGVWTAEMLLIFSLGRPDVLSFRDLGIRKGIMLLNGWSDLDEERFEKFRRRCSPYGTLASLLLWKLKDGGLNLL